ncbi:Lipoma HMGIC fusion partner-like protein [Aphelenchoides besseyi]|nr:Lipoma HMGIC fusion partner-like protein [Aphelenchoides besseyi]KAI6195108.1 Lipoma HMGIC fusion partner-like protein [Aphelenchoides besseyi]
MPDPTVFTSIGYIWVLLSVLATSCVCVGFYFPKWIVGSIALNGRQNVAYFGSFRRCNYPVFNEELQQFKMYTGCGQYVSFNDIPSVFWKISSLSIGLSCFISIVLSMILIPSCCFGIMRRELASWIRIFQTVSAVGVVIGCLLFPLGWTNSEVRDACGLTVGSYSLGDCHFGWSFYALLFGSLLLLLSALFSTCSTRPSATNNRPSSTTKKESSVTSRRRQFRRDDNSFDAEALINKNLRLPDAQPQWEFYTGEQSPFVPRHSELV